MKSSRNVIIALVVAIVLVAGAIIWLLRPHAATTSPGASTPSTSSAPASASSPSSASPASSASLSTTPTPSMLDPLTTLAGSYQKVLANPQSIEVSHDKYPRTGKYSYAITEVNADPWPDMLLRVESQEFSPIVVVTATSSLDKTMVSSDVLVEGAAGAGGSRLGVFGSNKGIGLYQIDGQSAYRERSSTLYQLSGTKLVAASDPEKFPIDAPLPDHRILKWFDSSDMTGIDAVKRGEIPSADGSQAQQSASPASGKAEFTGTLVKLDPTQAADGKPVPNGEPESFRYYVLVLDAPQTVTANLPNGQSTREVSKISLGMVTDFQDDSPRWDPLVGTHLTVTVPRDRMYWPTDTGLPLGMLRAGGAEPVSGR